MNQDAALLRRYVSQRSEEAFAELVRRHLRLVYGTALRRTNGDSHLAEEVAQEVFADLARNASTLEEHPVVHGWLYVATRNAAANAMRAEQRRKTREEKAHAMRQDEANPPAESWSRLRPELDSILDELDNRERDIVLLRFFEEQPFVEIGATLGISEDAARMRVERALDKLRAILARRGVTSTAAALGLALTAQGAVTVPAGLAASIASAAFASVAISSPAAFLAFMTTSKIVMSGVSVVAILAIGSALYQTRVARETAASLTAIRKERDELRVRSEAPGKPVIRAEQASLAVPKLSAATPSLPPLMEHVLNHPEAHAAYVQREILRIKTRFASFFRSAQLSPEKQDQFLKIQKDATEAKLDFIAALNAQGFSPDNLPKDRSAYPEITKLSAEWKEGFSAKMQALLGEDGYKFFEQYQRSVPARTVLDQVTAMLFYGDEPLAKKQAGELMQTLTQNPLQFQTPGTPANTMGGTAISAQSYAGYRRNATDMFFGGSPLDAEAPITDAAIAHAHTFLTPAQVAALQQLQAQQAAKIQLSPPIPGR